MRKNAWSKSYDIQILVVNSKREILPPNGPNLNLGG